MSRHHFDTDKSDHSPFLVIMSGLAMGVFDLSQTMRPMRKDAIVYKSTFLAKAIGCNLPSGQGVWGEVSR